ncbi:acetylornithine deacetylase (ArgE) [Pseudovibrio sp. FO-BEG1]|uniref:acetylornithine deacetylase n=1 Tax=Pseudovibrio sp. (strain FO-BEG1) TaxID=911045 RepID=UPI000238D384|nr:acetylornithine deacetylase [Pseudovibrio sp. FO-BEG1]AEV37025.1 acetylornithine deacetylase (ArgE) [Pseudovibrio sp. FO-BEG1]
MTMTSQEVLAKLVSFDTVSAKTNLPLIKWIEEYLTDLGVSSFTLPDETGEKASLFATIGGDGPDGYVLSGHTDVVPVAGQDWTTDPFTLREQDGLLYGRGSCDMKGFVACSLAKVPEMLKAPLKKPFHLMFSYDEEVGCIGVQPILHKLAGDDFKAEACFVGEPTEMQVVVAHKSKSSYRAVFTGLSCHSSLAPHGVNAVHYGARLVTKLEEMARKLAAGPSDALYDLPFSTAHTGVIKGGTALNIVPEHCEVIFEFRMLPSESTKTCMDEVERYAFEELLPEMRKVYPEANIEFVPFSEIPGLDTEVEADVTVLAKKLAGRNDHAKVAYGTEAGLIQNILDIPTVVCGPGNIEQAHKPDEFIKKSELDKCDAFLDRLIKHACA